MQEPDELRGERVILRQMVRSDVDEMANWPRFHEPELQWANLELTFPADRDTYFEYGKSNLVRRRFVIRNPAGDLIGTVGLRNLNSRASEGTLGIIMRADAVDQGYGTDTVQTIVRYAFEILNLKRVLLDVADDNPRAQRVYEKLGFVRIGDHLGPGAVRYIDMVIARPNPSSQSAANEPGQPRRTAK